jgi:transposase
MSAIRKKYTPELKAKIALEVLANHDTLANIASSHSLSGSMASRWSQELREQASSVFIDARKKTDTARLHEEQITHLHATIGQLTVERDWLKKKYALLGGIFP